MDFEGRGLRPLQGVSLHPGHSDERFGDTEDLEMRLLSCSPSDAGVAAVEMVRERVAGELHARFRQGKHTESDLRVI